MLESLEGKAGLIRYKPPLPAIAGLFGKPTVVNNVVTLASVPEILVARQRRVRRARRTGARRARWRSSSPATSAAAGLVEKALRPHACANSIEDWGGGTVQRTRRSGPCRSAARSAPISRQQLLDTPLDYEAFAASAAWSATAGIVVFDDSVNMAAQARFAMEFCAIESCGKCTPCRIGSVRGVEVIDRIVANENRDANLELLQELCDTMVDGSLCAMGGMTPFPVRSAVKYFPKDFEGRSAVQASAGVNR